MGGIGGLQRLPRGSTFTSTRRNRYKPQHPENTGDRYYRNRSIDISVELGRITTIGTGGGIVRLFRRPAVALRSPCGRSDLPWLPAVARSLGRPGFLPAVEVIALRSLGRGDNMASLPVQTLQSIPIRSPWLFSGFLSGFFRPRADLRCML